MNSKIKSNKISNIIILMREITNRIYFLNKFNNNKMQKIKQRILNYNNKIKKIK